uniref:E3 ubiquitin-protein ligase RNF139 isoform X1 n=2 Tax=Myxine glutinosa TaxID=7769 RepID=UPI00358FE79F
MASHGLGPPLRAVLDVSLRVPSVYAVDLLLNAPGENSTCTRLLGVLLALCILVLSRPMLFRLYAFIAAGLFCVLSAAFHHYGSFLFSVPFPITAETPWQKPATAELRRLCHSCASFVLASSALQLCLSIAFCSVLRLRGRFVLVLLPACILSPAGLVLGLSSEVQSRLALVSSLPAPCILLYRLLDNVRWFEYTAKYTFLVLRHMYQQYGLQVLVEDTWKRIHVPDILRVFWLTRFATQAVLLLYVVGETGSRRTTLDPAGAWDVLCNLLISGCDSTITVLGMSAVISSLARYLGLAVLAFIGSQDDEDRRLGFVAPVLFFLLALQTGLSGLAPDERLIRLSRNLCLLLTAVLHFIHSMADPVLMQLGTTHLLPFRRHCPAVGISLGLSVAPLLLIVFLWQRSPFGTWLFAIVAFCIELCLKVVVSLTVYGLFIIDGFYSTLWERLDDYVYYVRSTGSVVEFMFGVVMFGNGAYTMCFEYGSSKIRALMMCLHAYFNIYLQAKSGWKTFMNRQTAVRKIGLLPELTGKELREIGDVCSICYQEFTTSARRTPCNHYFHALCLRKWLYVQDTCPMCHQRVHKPGTESDVGPTNNNLNERFGGEDPEQRVVEQALAREELGFPAAVGGTIADEYGNAVGEQQECAASGGWDGQNTSEKLMLDKERLLEVREKDGVVNSEGEEKDEVGIARTDDEATGNGLLDRARDATDSESVKRE